MDALVTCVTLRVLRSESPYQKYCLVVSNNYILTRLTKYSIMNANYTPHRQTMLIWGPEDVTCVTFRKF